MAIQGSLKTLCFPELLSLLQQLRRTGILRIVSEIEERGFLFQSGNLVYATTRDPSRRLGAFLVRLGLITQDELEEHLDSPGSGEVYVGQRLIETGRLTAQDVAHAVRDQILDIVEEVMGWEDGAFYFDENELPFVLPEGTPVSTQSVLLEATRRADEKKLVRSLFPDVNVILARTRGKIATPADAKAQALLARVDGKSSVEKLLFTAPEGVQPVATLLHELLTQGYVQQVGVQVGQGKDLAVPDLQCFPVAPDLPGRLFCAFNQDSSEVSGVGEVVSHDPMLAAKLLRAVTLRRAELSRANTSIEYLVNQLGNFQLRAILVPEAIRGLFFPRAQHYWKEWWEHSQTVARLSKSVALVVGYSHPDETYLAGLLHNFGAFLLMCSDPVKYRQIAKESLKRRRDLQDLEEKTFGLSHSKAGAVCAEKWRFPKPLIQVMRQHHKVEADASNLLLNIVSVANGVVNSNGASVDYQASWENQFDASLNALHFNKRKALSLFSQSTQPQQPQPIHATGPVSLSLNP